MPRLTAEMITESPQFTNPVRDWELDLRGSLSQISHSLNVIAVEGQYPSHPHSHLEEGNSCVHGLPASMVAMLCSHQDPRSGHIPNNAHCLTF